MKKAIYISILMISTGLFSSCNLLDIKDISSINPEIWNSELDASLYVNSIYNSTIPTFDTNSNSSDETAPDFGNTDKLLGNLPTSSATDYSLGIYESIRNINIGLESVKKSNLSSPAKEQIIGQLHFLRAYQHWKLINVYGGIPYMTSVVDAFGPTDEIHKARNKTSECIQLLKSDLNIAIQNLPAKWHSNDITGGYGRATSVAAAALLGRILMFYASPQFTPVKDQQRWQEAYDANVLAKKLADDNGYGLMPITELIPGVNTRDLNQIFRTKANKEVILAKPYLSAVLYHGFEASTRPAEAKVNSNIASIPSNCPSLDLAKAFPMADGSPYVAPATPSANNAFSYIYKNRDPRFYSTIVYHGSIYPLAGNTGRIQWASDSLDEVTNKSLRTPTGFYCRKMIDPTITTTLATQTPTDWVEIRYAEVLLNVAECAVEIGKPDEMITLIGQLRDRAGIPAGTDGKYGLTQFASAGYSPIEIVMQERRIELAFENKRYYDLRRRNMFSTDLGTKILKLNGYKRATSRLTIALATGKTKKMVNDYIVSAGGITNAIDILYRDYFTVKAATVSPFAIKMNFPQSYPIVDGVPSYNFFDIPDAIMQRSPALTQTKGWPGGTFDPFE